MTSAAQDEAISYQGLTDAQADVLRAVHEATQEVYGRPALNSTMRAPCFKFFYELLERGPALGGRVDYLEIGSFQGSSLVVVGSVLRALGRLGTICSVDPYFPGGYAETPPFETEAVRKRSTPRMMRLAFLLYERAGLEVEHVRDISATALAALLTAKRTFDFIFVDGSHEKLNPMVDTALSLQLIRPGGYIMLDDVNWPDIRPIADLCDRHLKVVAHDFNKACYEIAGA